MNLLSYDEILRTLLITNTYTISTTATNMVWMNW